MPQFLAKRFDNRVRTLMAFFWVILFVFVNITSILYLGGLAINSIMGVPLMFGIIGLVLYSASFSIFGGLKAVVWTDVIQVVVLVFGGIMASYLVVDALGQGSYFGGLAHLYEQVPDKFDLILDKSNPSYKDLPGISVLIGGMWIANLYYWGNNQYIIQRALAAKSIKETQKGVAFAAFLKIFMPLIVVVPGIAAYVILQDPTAYGFSGEGIAKPDQAFPWVLNNFVGVGFKGLVFAALVAAIGSSISSMVNSASTIFTLDIYQPLLNKKASGKHLVNVGKIAAAGALVIGALVAPSLGALDQVFQYIQEYTGFISPGVVAVFLFGLFWKRTTGNAALLGIIVGFVLNLLLKNFFPSLPFLDRMGFTFLAVSTLIVLISMMENKRSTQGKENDMVFRIGLVVSLLAISVPSGFKIIFGDEGVGMWFGGLILAMAALVIFLLMTENSNNDPKGIELEKGLFKTNAFFNLSSVIVIILLTIIYAVFW